METTSQTNKSIRSVAEAYFAMQNASVDRPNWVPAAITNEQVEGFTKAIHEARVNKQSIVEFAGKQYKIKEAVFPELGHEKEIQKTDLDAAHKEPMHDAPTQAEKKEMEDECWDKGNAPEYVDMGKKIQAANKDDKETADSAAGMMRPSMAERKEEEDENDLAAAHSEKALEEGLYTTEEVKQEDENVGTFHFKKEKAVQAGKSSFSVDGKTFPVKAESTQDAFETKQNMDEVLNPSDPASKWIHDFVHSKNPKFAGKSKEMRQKMALGAYYSSQKESVQVNSTKNMLSVAEAYAQMNKVSVTESTDLNESVKMDEEHIDSGTAQHNLLDHERAKHAAYMNKKHGVTTKFHGDDELSFHGPKKNVKSALINHYHGERDDAKEMHPHVFDEADHKEMMHDYHGISEAINYHMDSADQHLDMANKHLDQADKHSKKSPQHRFHKDEASYHHSMAKSYMKRARQKMKTGMNESTEDIAIHNPEMGSPDHSVAGPEVMDPTTQKMRDLHVKNVKIEDRFNIGYAQDGANELQHAELNRSKPEDAVIPKIK